MKKHLTVAAFLAAGTALASAATVLTEEIKSWNSFSANDYTVLGKGAGSTEGTVSLSNGVITMDAAGRVQFNLGTDTLNLKNNVYQVELSVSGWTPSNAPSIAFGVTDNSVTNAQQKFGIGFNANSNANYWAGTVDGGRLGVEGNSETVTGGHSNLSGVLTVTIGRESMSATFLKTGSTSTTAAELLKTTNTAITGTVSTVTLGGWATTSDRGSAMTVSSMKISQVIPEPSAFGLLAGAGALALVAARRRRKS